MGRFLAFLLVFVLGGTAGIVLGGVVGGAGGAYLGACTVIDTAVAGGSLTQDQANALIKSIASEIDLNVAEKQRVVDTMKRADQPPSPCQTAIEAL
jgi:outer membrane lipoprotein SlyB